MRNAVLICFCLMSLSESSGQGIGVSPAKPFLPTISVQGRLIEDSGDGVLEAGEKGGIRLQIGNTGASPGRDIQISVQAGTLPPGVIWDDIPPIKSLGSGKNIEVRIPILATDSTREQTADVIVHVSEGGRRTIAHVTIRTKDPPLATVVVTTSLLDRTRKTTNSILAGDSAYLVVTIKKIGTNVARGFDASVRVADQDSGLVRVLPTGTVNANTGVEVSGKEFVLKLDTLWMKSGLPVEIDIRDTRGRRVQLAEVVLPVRHSIGTLYADGMRLAGLDDLGGALDRFQGVLRINPEHGPAALQIARICLARQDTAEAIKYYEMSARLKNQEAIQWLNENTSIGTEASYAKIDPDPFQGEPEPISIGILPFFGGRNEDLALAGRLYDELKKAEGNVRTRFAFYSLSALKTQQSALGIKRLDSRDRAALSSLRENLDIRFVLSGERSPSGDGAIILDLTRTSDGRLVLRQRYQSSLRGSAMDGILRLFDASVVPRYGSVRVLSQKK